MKLNQATEASVLKAYELFWESNLAADMEVFSSYLVDDFSIFGTANGEFFFSKEDAIVFYTATADQMRGNIQLRNRNITVQPVDEASAIVREMSDVFVLSENEWICYGQARISCVLKKIDGNWKALHQHASFPDHRTEEGQQIATEKIKLENLELKEAVRRRTIELETKTRELENALMNLKAAQAQLIQSEKMASLGELTAGIAHEIQNPLNFVNNFSDVNKELLEELQEEADKGNFEEVKAIAVDVISNEEKINHHGKRADAIVKGMLQHSQSSKGQKEPTDINALADEYLRLSYHGLRAKDKTFNATLKTDFDETIGTINIISQDIGRVVLNLLTNAFHAVDEKKKACQTGLTEAGKDYESTVSITTKNHGDKIEIRVDDNGNGIPQKVLDKIFQPFFTTKPTGQGTGLGLSLSYDIITQGHGGELYVETKEGEGSTFIITLPISKQ